MAENTPPKNNVLPFRQKLQNQPNPEILKEKKQIYENNVEDIRHYSLAEDRAGRQKDREIEILKLNLKKPSKFWLYPIFFWSFVGDALDVVLYFFPVIGQVASAAIDIFILTPIIALLSHPYNKASGHNFTAGNDVEAKIKAVEQKIKLYRQRYASLLRKTRKIKFLRKPVRKLALKVKTVRKKLVKSYLGRLLLRTGLDVIPIVELVPWRLMGAYKPYKYAKLSYEESMALLGDYHLTRAEEIEATNEMIAIEQEEQEAEFSDESQRAA